MHIADVFHTNLFKFKHVKKAKRLPFRSQRGRWTVDTFTTRQKVKARQASDAVGHFSLERYSPGLVGGITLTLTLTRTIS